MNVFTVLRLLLLGVLDALGALAAASLWLEGEWTLLGILAFGLVAGNVVILVPRAYPLRYIVPGLFFFVAFVLFPMLYTVYLSITNLSTAHLLSKEQVIHQLNNAVVRPPGSTTLSFWAYADEDGEVAALLLRNPDGALFLADVAAVSLVEVAADDPRLADADGDGTVDRVDGLARLAGGALLAQMAAFENLVFPYGDEVVKVASLTAFRTARRQFSYDPERGELLQHYAFDASGNAWNPVEPPVVFTADDATGNFVGPQGEPLTPGWTVFVGLDNYLAMFQNPQIVGPFFRVFGWTFLFAVLSVVLTFALGLLLAVILNDEQIRFRRTYRVVLILPWAIPAFISIMVWRGLLNPLGPGSALINDVFGFVIPWFSDPVWAKVGLVLLNLWLGFPYMMTVSLGALQSIPSELYEAAYVDGASRWKQFRTITFPLLLVSLGPLLVGSFAFNFNNFNVVYLFTGGGPPIPGAQTPAQSTDILISYTYQVAFNGGWGQQYGFAAAITIGIFLIVGTISAINFKWTGALEEVGQG